MVANGNTAVNIGMVWGWRTLSPRWNGQWYGSSTYNLPSGYSALPLDYGEQNMDKVVVLMTDGENTIGSKNVYNSFGRQKLYGTSQPYSSYWDNNGFMNPYLPNDGDDYPDKADQKLLDTCTAMKAAGIKIYTVLLVDGNSNMMRDCATSPKHAFVAKTADDLKKHFNTIGEELSNLRISK
ncbi:MAG: hypothetical protein EP348_07665 [Alphaproteobacteria bacterium]|nr:MAG: hypothetical protein EP348_07665 [Alphaproteobacteria bacterium]